MHPNALSAPDLYKYVKEYTEALSDRSELTDDNDAKEIFRAIHAGKKIRKGFIYKITCLITNKAYIGQSYNIKSRINSYRCNRHFQQKKLFRSTECHGLENHILEIIDYCHLGYSNCIINLVEQYWISEYDSYKNGFNCNVGGYGNLGGKHTEESKKRRCEMQKGRKHSEESKQKQSASMKGKPSPMKGVKKSEESIIKMVESRKRNAKPNTRKGVPLSEETKAKQQIKRYGNKNRCRKIFCVSNCTVYDSEVDAAKELGVIVSSISQVCHGGFKHTKGYIFRFATADDLTNSEGIIEQTQRIEYSNRDTKRIFCFNNGMVYESITKAANALKLNGSAISAVCTGKYEHTQEYVFRYADKNEQSNAGKAHVPKYKTNQRKVLCVNTNVVYKSLRDATIQLSLSRWEIENVCNEIEQSTKSGLVLKWVNSPIDRSRVKKGLVMRKVLCVSNGIVYGSLKQAGIELGVSRNNICRACKGKLKRVGGYEFRYAD